MIFYRTKNKKNSLKDVDFYHLHKNIKSDYWIQEQMLQKPLPEKVVHKAGKYLGNKRADAVTNSSDDKVVNPDENQKNVEEIIIPLEKKTKKR